MKHEIITFQFYAITALYTVLVVSLVLLKAGYKSSKKQKKQSVKK